MFVRAVQEWPSFVSTSAHTLSARTSATSAARRTALWLACIRTARATPTRAASCVRSAANASKHATGWKATWGRTLGSGPTAAPTAPKTSPHSPASTCMCGGTPASGRTCARCAVRAGRLGEICRNTWGLTRVNGRMSARTVARPSPSPVTWQSIGGYTPVRHRHKDTSNGCFR